MRLQISVQRHELPQVRFFFNTASNHGPGKQRLATISELLSAINTIVPLESIDGEWGLEDYVVEVAATADQEHAYECFHFQELKDVLKEDDEVVIRGLSNEELRERRQGGRLQITTDGRHLIDGLSWGKRWRGGHGRPEIDIPPRKRRRLMIEPEDAKIELEFPPPREPFQVPDEMDDDDDDDEDYDEDYEEHGEEAEAEGLEDSSVDADELDEEAELLSEQNATSSPRHVKITGVFANADTSDLEDGEEGQDVTDDSDIDIEEEEELSEGAEGFAAELQALINDAPDVTKNLPPRKRKRGDAVELNGAPTKSVSFEGFSSPAKATRSDSERALPNGLSRKNGLAQSELLNRQSKAEPNVESSSSGSSSDADSDSSSDLDASSNSDESESSSDDDSESGESTSSSESSLSSERSTTKAASTRSLNNTKPIHTSTTLATVQVVKPTTTTAVVSQAPPGSGTVKTKRHNSRTKKKRVLTQLKAEGKLPENANFEDLKAYFAKSVGDLVGDTVEQPGPNIDLESAEIAARKEEIFRRLNATTSIPTDTEPVSQTTPTATVGIDQPMTDLPATSNTRVTSQGQPDFELGVSEGKYQNKAVGLPLTASAMVDNENLEETEGANAPREASTLVANKETTSTEEIEGSSAKRSKLDLASSRRMVFNALGVRNPKTPAAEQALREKLSKPVRQIKPIEKPQGDKKTLTALPQDLWKSKLTISAVECGPQGGLIETPTFPFKHPWQVRKEKERIALQEDAEMLNYDDQATDEHDTQEIEIVATDRGPSPSMTISKTLTAGSANEDDDIAVPSSFDVLTPLTDAHLLKGNVIAYKELQMNARFEPEQSSYRTARIVTNDNGQLQLKLSAKDRRHTEAQYDETGQRVYNKFDMPDEDDEEPDDGLRQLTIDEMIEPKFVSLSQSNIAILVPVIDLDPDVSQVENSVKDNMNPSVDVTATQNAPESEAEEANLNSSRHAEIYGMIKEAGFDSALDDQLLEPLQEPVTLRGGSSTGEQREQKPKQDFEPEPEQSAEQIAMSDEQVGEDDSWRSTMEPVSSVVRVTDDSSYVPTSSPPSESIVDSVRYPHLSELDTDTPSAAAKSSTHQDAQKLTPIPLPEMEQTATLHDDSHLHEPEPEQVQEKAASRQVSAQPAADSDGDVSFSSLPSEVEQTQSPDIHNARKSKTQQEGKSTFSPLPQHDGSVSPVLSNHSNHYNDPDNSDNESLDSAGLPSIRFLTSSQTQHHASRSHSKSVSTKQELPRRSPRTKKTTALSTDWSDTETTTNASSQPRVKVSASQRESQRPRMSQIPEETVVVDLTESSPPAPPKNMEEDKTKEQKDAAEASRGGKENVSGPSGSQQGQAAALRRSFEGLGERSYLKRKKKNTSF
ncbi:hypothetical protein H2198_000015 [Neophaeococcomyces mojaviensis]|uniref:Uncharacterized protein n=1 Tax=Neophaeococcomyces mojaviensis TaxID=3383035 RepID=A0ACC3AL83_9EURO|nr:hypothetical protein H2198_000015 [Knufia sp. JES_112]